LLKDHLALQAFTLDNLVALWFKRDVEGAYFMMPLVALNLTMRCPILSIETRLDLLKNAFKVFFKMVREFPSRSGRYGLLQKGPRNQKKTFWTQEMCRRAGNLCVGLDLAITKWGNDPDFRLALNRIASYPVECHFGTTRSACEGDARWDSFFRAQVDSVMIHRFMRELELQPYIRRFKSTAGCTIDPTNPGDVWVRFPEINKRIDEACSYMALNQTQKLFDPRHPSFMTPFLNLARALHDADWHDKVRKSSRLSGNSITGRFFMLPRDAGTEADLAEELALPTWQTNKQPSS
jgi:hypothetical protein